MLSYRRKHMTTMAKLAKPALSLLVSLAFAQSASAAGPLGAGVNVGAGVQVGAGANLPRVGASAGGAAAIGAGAGTRVSPSGAAGAANPSVRALENANGQIVADREFGLDRAEERRSEEGAEHEKASDAPRKRSERQTKPGGGASANASTRSSTDASARAPRGTSADAGSNTGADTGVSAKQ